MGSPLGPMFSNVFMSDFERKHMDALRKLGVVKWFRYVDDVFVSLTDASRVDEILHFLNEQHKNIKLTVEHEERGKLPFLDTCVVRTANRYITRINRKKTFTGVYLNWRSLTANRYKIGLIRCLAERIWRICSEEKDRLSELEKLKVILYRNDYPTEVVERTIKKFIESKQKPTENDGVNKVEKTEKRYMKLPYVGRSCEDFAFRLKRVVEDCYQQVDFNVAFQAPHTIGKMFPFKDNIKRDLEKSMVVYCLTCSCGHTYIGKTDRILNERMPKTQKNQTMTFDSFFHFFGHF